MTMNRSEECAVDQKMMKTVYQTITVDKPLDLKQNSICDKTIKNYEIKSDEKNGIDSADNGSKKLALQSSGDQAVHSNTIIHHGAARNSGVVEVGGGSGFGGVYPPMFLQTSPQHVVNGNVVPPTTSAVYSPQQSVDLTALYNSGFFQLQNMSDASGGRSDGGGDFEEGVKSEVDTSVPATRAGEHECVMCHKTFNNKHNLAKHMNLHTGVEKFSCSICQKKFSEKGNMTKHMNIHTGSKTYSCPICNKAFFWLSSLSKHKAIHSGERVGKFECVVCKKAFGEKGNLTKHMNVHTGNKMFACDVCNKGFYWKSSLIMHRTIHTGHKMYACPTCDKRFRWKTSFNKHMSAHLEQSAS